MAAKDNKGNGILLNGVNANVINLQSGDFETNLGWGIMDNSDLGNVYVGYHCLGNQFGCIITNIAVNQSTIIGGYDEGGTPTSILSPMTISIGGVPAPGYDRSLSRGSTMLSLTNERSVIGGSAYRTNNAIPQQLGDAGGDLDNPHPAVMAQLGSSNGDFPYIFSFGAGNEGGNESGAPHLKTRPNANYYFNYSRGTYGWYSLDYQQNLGGVPNVASLMRMSGSQTALGASGKSRLWFPRGAYFGQQRINGNGLVSAYEPQFHLSSDVNGLTLDANFKTKTAQFVANANVSAASPLNRSMMRVLSYGTAQVESNSGSTTNTTGFGFIHIIVTSAYFSGASTRLVFTEADNNLKSTPAQQAVFIRAALAADADINALYIVGGTGAAVTLTDRVERLSDPTLNLEIKADPGTPPPGFTNSPTSTETQAGTTAGVYQVETMTVAGTVGTGGTVIVTVFSPNIGGTAKDSINVSVTAVAGETATQTAVRIATALNNNSRYNVRYTATTSGANVITTANAFAANDDALEVTYALGTATGLTPVTSSANTTAGNSGDDVVQIAIKKGDGTVVWKTIP